MKERKKELDVIRVIACFLVVVVHVSGYGMEVMDPMTGNWATRNLVNCLVRCAVPVFFMISGVLFMDRELSIRTLYRKYVARLLAAWAVWSALYASIDYIAERKAGPVSVGYFFSRFVQGHYHMWFLPALLTVYLFLPILQRTVRACSGEELKYLGALILAGVIGKKTLDPFLAGGPAWDALWENLAVPVSSIGIVYFVLGYCLYKQYDRYPAGAYLAVYILSVLLMAGGNQYWAYLSGGHEAGASGYLTVGVLISSSAFFLFLVRVFSGRKTGGRSYEWIRRVSEATFGVYLVHTLFIEQVYRRLGLTQDLFPAIVSIVLFSVLTFLISLPVSFCIRRVPLIGKWIA